jgi:hypothetical protein
MFSYWHIGGGSWAPVYNLQPPFILNDSGWMRDKYLYDEARLVGEPDSDDDREIARLKRTTELKTLSVEIQAMNDDEWLEFDRLHSHINIELSKGLSTIALTYRLIERGYTITRMDVKRIKRRLSRCKESSSMMFYVVDKKLMCIIIASS